MRDEYYFQRSMNKAIGADEDEDGGGCSVFGNSELARLLDMSNDELDAFVNFITVTTKRSVLMSMANDVIESPPSYEACIITSSITALLVAKAMHSENAQRKCDDKSKYPITLMAEAHVRNADGDLDSIWPTEYAKEVLGEFSPEEAFMVGVVCGKSHG